MITESSCATDMWLLMYESSVIKIEHTICRNLKTGGLRIERKFRIGYDALKLTILKSSLRPKITIQLNRLGSMLPCDVRFGAPPPTIVALCQIRRNFLLQMPVLFDILPFLHLAVVILFRQPDVAGPFRRSSLP